jgi:hypothetical protein
VTNKLGPEYRRLNAGRLLVEMLYSRAVSIML